MACELNLDLRHFDVEQAFVQSLTREEMFNEFASGLR